MSRFHFSTRFLVLTGWLLGSILVSSSPAEETPPIFESDVLPIFNQKCSKCHGEKVQKGGLNLSSMAGVQKGGESGESGVAETVDESMLWIMLDGGGMPPQEEPQLAKAELDKIRTWIEGGAKSAKAHQPTEEKITQHDVLPIVLLRCTTCHGARLKENGLDLRTPASMRKGGKSGPAFVSGDPDQSLMIQRIESEACPPRSKLLKFFVRRPSTAEVKTLREWIAAGAREFDIPPDMATSKPDPLVTDEDREHWAFQAPEVESEFSSIDEFLLKKLNEKDLAFSPEADRDTLIRRAYLDLVGLPPSLEEWKKWHDSEDSQWYSAMIEHLLTSPRYGERWGRYWLDVAGYADSEGGISADPVRQVAWKYRDYVIESYNEDKPYDRFLLEQIAGDELVDYENAPAITPEIVENLVATGFLRMGIDETGSRTMNFVPERLGVVSDAIKVMGSGVMGLTLECARCHTHKYDPIPHRDYYRFKAIFQGALDEHDWLTFKNRKLDLATAEQRRRYDEVNKDLRRKLKKLQSEGKDAVVNLQLEMLRQHYPEQSEADNQATIRALKIADNNRTLTQKILVEKLQKAEIIPMADQPEPVQKAQRDVEEIERQILGTEREMEPPLAIRALWDRGEPSPTYVLRRGEHDKPGQLVGPGVPSVLTDGKTPFDAKPPFPGKTGRRLAFARWLTRPDHPLTARVMVNRIWHHHFGNGLVRTLENFGVKGDRPSHPELLDWLAVEFVKGGWSIKQMHRLMMNSRAYKQSNHVSQDRLERDPQNRLLSRMPVKRMDAESLRDSLLFVAGKLDQTPGGLPDPITVDQNGQVSARPTAEGRWRRSVYLQYRRTAIPSMMETFDYPEMGPNCIERNISTVSPQSLMLMNNKEVHELAVAFADRVREEANDRDSQIDLVYQIALSRLPSEKEKQLGTQSLKELEQAWNGDAQNALESYCHTILNSAAFLYVD